MRVQLLAGEKTSRDVANCAGKRQERGVMLPSGVESEDSADTNAEEDAGQMWRGVDGVWAGREDADLAGTVRRSRDEAGK